MALRAASPSPWPALAAVATVVILGLLVAYDLTDAVDAALIDLVRSEALRDPLSPLRWITEAGSTWAVTAVAGGLIVGLTLVGRLLLGALAALFISAAALGNAQLTPTVGEDGAAGYTRRARRPDRAVAGLPRRPLPERRGRRLGRRRGRGAALRGGDAQPLAPGRQPR